MDIYDLALENLIKSQMRQAAELRKQAELTEQSNTSNKAAESGKTHVATRMENTPGFQLPPSPGGIGITYVNPRAVRQPVPSQPENQAAEKPKLSLVEAAQQRLKEVQAARALDPEGLKNSRPIVRFDKKLNR